MELLPLVLETVNDTSKKPKVSYVTCGLASALEAGEPPSNVHVHEVGSVPAEASLN